MDLGERVAAAEAVLLGLRDDMVELREETLRTRGRLHSLESTAASLVHAQHERIRHEERRDRARGRQLQMLAFVVTVVGIMEPIAKGLGWL